MRENIYTYIKGLGVSHSDDMKDRGCARDIVIRVCRQRRLTLFGHTCRLPPDAPSRQALEEAIRPVKKLVGGQKKTLIGLIEEDLKTIQITIREATNIAQDKKDYQCLVHDVMSRHL